MPVLGDKSTRIHSSGERIYKLEAAFLLPTLRKEPEGIPRTKELVM